MSETIDPGPFQPSASNLDFDAPDDGTTLTQMAYDTVRVDSGTTLNVDPTITEYFLNDLEVESNATIVLQPGDYWIDDLALKQGAQLQVAGSGTARIYVNTVNKFGGANQSKFEDDVLVNSPAPGISGDPSKLFLYVYDDDIKLGADATFSGFVYGEQKIETEERAAFFGALSAGRNMILEDNSFVSYDAAAVVNADFGCLCSCVNSTLLDYLSIGASPIGVTCEAQTVTVTAILSDGSVHDTYGGTISLSTSTGLGDWIVIGSAGSFTAGAANSGVATVPSAGYAEVGSIVLRASSLDYLGDPAADILGFSPEIGRFYPDYFELLLDAVSPSCTVGASSYTYMDEPALGIDYRLLARNASGQTTLNYDTTLGYAAGQVRYHAEDSDDGVDLSARVSAGAGAWELGSYVRPSATAGYTATDARFSRAATEDGPYRQLQIGLSVFAEPDGRNLSILDLDPATAGDCGAAGTCSATMVGTPAEVRFGRLRVLEAYGPETLNLPVPILTEYFDGTGFVRNTDDGNGITACTRLPLSSVDLQTGTALGTPIPVGAGTSIGTMSHITGTDFFFSSGDAALILSAPGVGNTGAITVDVDLTTHPWLRFDWDGDGMNDDDPPQASGVFGRYRGHDRIIYWSEQR